MFSFDKYASIALLALRTNLAYPGEVLSRLFFLTVILYVFLQLWKAVYAVAPIDKAGGFTLAQMMWYLAVTEAIMLSSPRVSRQVDEEVRTGSIAVKLVRPLSYPLATLSADLGERSIRFLLNLVPALAICYCFVGVPQISIANFAALIAAVPLAFVIDFLGYFFIGLLAFWIEDTTGASLIYSRITMILGGMLLPMHLFPDWCRPLVEASPFPNVVYGPANLFVNPSAEGLLVLISRQIASVAVFALAVVLLWRLALRRVSSNGG